MPEVSATEPSPATPVIAQQAVSPSGIDLAAQVAELNARLIGFQTALNTKTHELTAVSTARDGLALKLAEESAKTAALTVDVNKYSTEAATSKDGLERFKVIAQHGLVADEDQGLLRQDLKGAEFSNYLETFAARMQSAIGQAPVAPVRSAAGSAPAVGANRQNAGAQRDIIQAQLTAATRSGDLAAFDVAYEQLRTLPKS